MSDLPFGIDISKHQGNNDFVKMRANTAIADSIVIQYSVIYELA